MIYEVESNSPVALLTGADDQVDAYRAGYRAAIIATAACFGILVREADLNAAMLAIAAPRGTL